jgi:hypothetical protein
MVTISSGRSSGRKILDIALEGGGLPVAVRRSRAELRAAASATWMRAILVLARVSSMNARRSGSRCAEARKAV